VGLDEDAVDLFEIDQAGLVADRFDERTQQRLRVRRRRPSPERTMRARLPG